MATFRKVLTEVRQNLYERLDNDAKSYRYEKDDDDVIRLKIRYLNRHLRDLQSNESKEKELIPIYGYLGLGYMKLDDHMKAREYFDIQLDMAIDNKDEFMQRMAYANLGVINKYDWKLNEASFCYEKSLEIAIKHGHEAAQGRLYNNMANIFELQMDFERSIELRSKHLKIATDMGDRDGIVKSCGSLSALYHTTGDLHNAIRFLEQLMDQLRQNLRTVDCLADDKSDSDDGGYIDNPNDDNDDDVDGNGTTAANTSGKKKKLTKLKSKLKKK